MKIGGYFHSLTCLDPDFIEIICKKCHVDKFIVIKPKFEVSNDSEYWWCRSCIRSHVNSLENK